MDLKAIFEFLGIAGGPTLLGVFIINGMWKADEAIKPESRAAWGRSSRAFWVHELRNFTFFRDLFDTVYRTQIAFRPSARRFLLVGPITIAIMALIMVARAPSFIGELRNAPATDLAGLTVVLLTVNLMFDYLSVWVSRACIALLGRNILLTLVGLVLDAVLSILLFVGGWFVGFALASALFNGSQNVVDSTIELFSTPDLYVTLIESLKPLLTGVPADSDFAANYSSFFMAVSILSTIASSLWFWFYTGGLLLHGLVAIVTVPLRPLFKHLDFEATPLRVNGIICGLALIAVGAVMGLAERMHL